MKKRFSFSFLGLVYLIVGFIIAVTHHYITFSLVKGVASAVLAVVLWWLPLLGVSLHLH
jgi:hypothetical protein